MPSVSPVKNDLDLAFNKKRTNDRKEWLLDYKKEKIPDFNKKIISVNEFVNDELIHFSNEDNDRSIPNMMDGLKPSQRKVLFGSFKRNLNKTDVKVAQLAGYISEHAAYHHGECHLRIQSKIWLKILYHQIMSTILHLLDSLVQGLWVA